MAKGKDSQKAVKKEAIKTPKEKKAEKRAKKAAKQAIKYFKKQTLFDELLSLLRALFS